MPEPRFTPGPWTVENHGEDGDWWTVMRGAWDVSHNGGSRPGVVADAKYSAMTPAENEANAYLIAAAPDLYRELDHLIRLLAPLERDGRIGAPGLATLNGARKAIARARGEEAQDA